MASQVIVRIFTYLYTVNFDQLCVHLNSIPKVVVACGSSLFFVCLYCKKRNVEGLHLSTVPGGNPILHFVSKA